MDPGMTTSEREQALEEIARLAAIMDRLRGDDGCAWDKAQDFASIAPYTLEEAYEVADAIARSDMTDLCEELGDLLLQVVFHARMAAEAGAFTLADVARGIADKMERRHPHLFGPAPGSPDARTVAATWEAIKAAEKPRQSVLDGVALALPALVRADKISSRAARTGFDWPDAAGARAKLLEELAELEAAETSEARIDEAGDLLLAAVNYLRKLGVEPEAALRVATDKFERRFRAIEQAPGFAGLPLESKEALWAAVKTGEARDER
jgi:ATP diphosphatase